MLWMNGGNGGKSKICQWGQGRNRIDRGFTARTRLEAILMIIIIINHCDDDDDDRHHYQSI